MPQHYSDPDRKNDAYALPDVETFQESFHYDDDGELVIGTGNDTGWFYWFCFPGCLPNGDPLGPFETETAALNDAREQEEPAEEDDCACEEPEPVILRGCADAFCNRCGQHYRPV